MLSDQLCGIELGAVRELLGYMPFTPTGHVHPAIVGEFALRGRQVRVLDLRIRFGLPVTRTDDTVMIVVETLGVPFAVIVDSAVGLENLAAVQSTAARIDSRFIESVVPLRDQSLNLLNLNNTLIIPIPMPKAA